MTDYKQQQNRLRGLLLLIFLWTQLTLADDQVETVPTTTGINNIFKVCGSGFGPVTCECNPKLWPPAVNAACGFDTPVCFPPGQDSGACGFPTLEVAFRPGNILRFASPAVFRVCYNDLTIARATIAKTPIPLCFGLGSGGVRNLISALFPSTAVFGDSTFECEATLGDSTCGSCSLCQDADGNDGPYGCRCVCRRCGC